MTRSITSSITTNLKIINLGVMVFACLALAQTSTRAVPTDPVDPPGTTPLPPLTAVGVSGDAGSINITTGFECLAGKDYGPDGGLGNWDIGSIGAWGTIGDPGDNSDRHRHWRPSGWQYNRPPCQTVPDGGSSALLLGLGFLGLGFVSRWRRGADLKRVIVKS
jgi:VPDSG-CTERM motif